MKRRTLGVIVALCAVIAASVVWVATRDGVVLMPDSMSYLGAAASLNAHRSLRIPMANWNDFDSTSALRQFPPGYSIVLAIAGRLGATPMQAPRVVASLVVASSIFLLAALLLWCDAGWWSLAAPLLLMSVRGVALGALTALSDPLFVVTVLFTLYLMVRYPEHAWAYGVAAASASMVRYVGVALVVGTAVYAFRYAWKGVRRDITNPFGAAALAGLPGMIVIGAWQLRARANATSTPMTDVRWSGDPSAALHDGLRTVVSHLVPFEMNELGHTILATAIGIMLLGTTVRAWRRPHPASSEALRNLMVASLLLSTALFAVILYARLFVGDAIPFDDRILAPPLLCAVIGVFAATMRATARLGRTVLVAWLAIATVSATANASNMMIEREDYAATAWQYSASALWLRAHATGCTLFTNDPVAVYFTTGRPSRVLPMSLAIDSVQQFAVRVRASHGLVVQHPVAFIDMADAGIMARALGLTATQFSDSAIVWSDALAPCPTPPLLPQFPQ